MRLALVLLVLAALAAGCTKDEGPVATNAIEPGYLTGTVTDAALVPLAGANVTVDGTNETALTDAAGAFAFTLLPGEYVVLASHVDFKPGALRASVLSAQPSTLAFQLAPIPRITPRVEVAEAQGYLACSALVLRGEERTAVACGAQDPNEAPTVEFGVASHDGLETVVLEVVWDAGTDAARSLRVDAVALVGEDEVALGTAEGASPLVLPLAGRLVQGEAIRLTLSPAGSFLDEEAGNDVGVALQQEFTAYASLFYHQAAPGGYSALSEG